MKKQIFMLAMLIIFIAIIAGCKAAPEDIFRATIIEKVLIESEQEEVVYWEDKDNGAPLIDFPGASSEIKRSISKGDEAVSQNRISAAIEYYKDAFDLGLEEPMLVFRIGWLMQKDNPLKAAWYYNVANELYKEKNNGEELNHALFNAASCYLMAGKFKDEFYYDEEISTDSRIKDIKLMKRKGALSMLNDLLEVDKRYLYAYYNRAFCHYYLGCYEESLRDMKIFLKNGGKKTIYIAPALDLVTTCENELSIPDSERFQLAAAPKPATD